MPAMKQRCPDLDNPDSIEDEDMDNVQRLTDQVDYLTKELAAVSSLAKTREERLLAEMNTLVELNALYKARGEDAHTKSRDVSSVIASFDTRLKQQQELYERRLLAETTARRTAEAEVNALKKELAKLSKSSGTSPSSSGSSSAEEVVSKQSTTGTSEAHESPTTKFGHTSPSAPEHVALVLALTHPTAHSSEAGGQPLSAESVAEEGIVNNRSSGRSYPSDLSLPGIKSPIYTTDDFRMYHFKIRSCSRAYSHDWIECPFVHPGENARRRDPRLVPYNCMPCPDFRKQSCKKGDWCEYAHGVFECWLHPQQYKTRLCKDLQKCHRAVCFFAHKEEEKRPIFTVTGCALPSPRPQNLLDIQTLGMNVDFPTMSPASALLSESQEGMQCGTPAMSPAALGAAPGTPTGTWPPAVPNLHLPSRLQGGTVAQEGAVSQQGRPFARPMEAEYSMPPRSPMSPPAARYPKRSGFAHLGLQIPTSPSLEEFNGEGSGVTHMLSPNCMTPPVNDAIHRYNSEQLLQEYLGGGVQKGGLPASPGQNGQRQGAVRSGRNGFRGPSPGAGTAGRVQPLWRNPQPRMGGGHVRANGSPCNSNVSNAVTDWSSPGGRVDWAGHEAPMRGRQSPAGKGDLREGGWGGQRRGGTCAEVGGSDLMD